MSDLKRLGQEVAQHLVRKGPKLDVERGAARLQARRPKPTLAFKPFALAAVAAAAVLVFILWGRGAMPLTYVVEHGSMHFSDGTVLQLAKDTSTQVTHIDAHGADIELTRGQLTADVHAQPEARWKLRAGPYAVEVTGTRFTMTWDPPAGRLTVVMHEGSVLVRGPHLGHAHALTAPASLAVSREDGILAPPSPASAPSATSSVVAQPSATQTGPPPSREPPPATPPSAADLLDAAQAARLQGEAARAQQLLQRLRAAFPDSVEARTATFMSGRSHFDAGRDAAAIPELQAYLTQGGPFSSEAEVLLILALHRSGRTEEAKARARALVAAHPQSAHARRVEELLE